MYSEPKWDGYRTIALIKFDGVALWSRQGKELTRVLPDLAAALGAQVPSGVVLDGEAVIWNRDRLDFEALQRRRRQLLEELARDWAAPLNLSPHIKVR